MTILEKEEKMDFPKLIILSVLNAKKVGSSESSKFILTQKLIDGTLEYQKHWPGQVVLLAEEDASLSNNLDNILVDVNKLPFQVDIIDFKRVQESQAFQTASVVLASSDDFRQNHISAICEQLNIPCVYVTEYSLKTRIQIINATTKNPAIRLRRYFWQMSQEAKQRKAIEQADAIQCNGVPTYEAYREINPNSMLYFDSRVAKNMLVNEAEMAKRISHCLDGSPLRLLFSGRLTKIKGADHLIPIAEELRRLGVEFEMFICGDGDLRKSIQMEIARTGLSDSVKMLGVLKFKDELIPFIKKNIDLFVCCHRQGDPSCTYMETVSCGVPIVGYANEAFEGFMQHSKAGWAVKMNHINSMAKKILELSTNRKAIADESYKSLNFVKSHTFEKTFERRINHIKQAASIQDF
ncbi:glycosyltransferase [Nodosilinea sp. E11]|uniref:glycosyltransferase n=1 Tax=Nodosilinea sp. E11 TaxID=3037479 RepID=UPI002934E952|nr:glycosyltransferase [Nodosilinea sp. E11]WOD41687.1 glycosyltransferase [Nodosilinea sp. E11]